MAVGSADAPKLDQCSMNCGDDAGAFADVGIQSATGQPVGIPLLATTSTSTTATGSHRRTVAVGPGHTSSGNARHDGQAGPRRPLHPNLVPPGRMSGRRCALNSDPRPPDMHIVPLKALIAESMPP